MSMIRRRLEEVEARKAFHDYCEAQRRFKGRTQDELRFFSIHGYFPEVAGGELPERQEFTVGGIRTVITTEPEGCE
jgi:hypothetical protein